MKTRISELCYDVNGITPIIERVFGNHNFDWNFTHNERDELNFLKSIDINKLKNSTSLQNDQIHPNNLSTTILSCLWLNCLSTLFALVTKTTCFSKIVDCIPLNLKDCIPLNLKSKHPFSFLLLKGKSLYNFKSITLYLIST